MTGLRDALAGPPKTPLPPLSARATPPAAIRLRKSVLAVVVIAAAALLAAALAWAFILGPGLRPRAHARTPAPPDAGSSDTVRPSERVTDRPASYAQLAPLPPPRRLDLGGAGAAVADAPRERGHRRDGAPDAGAGGAPDPVALARQSGLFFPAGAAVAAAAPPGAAPPTGHDDSASYNPHRLMAPLNPYELKAGALIPAALLTALDTGRPGPVVATVTENIFDTVTGRTLVIPQGARLIGEHEGDSRYGEHRAFVQWDRLILPNGKSLLLSREPAVDAEGATGVEGRVQRRLLPLAAATLLAGAITTVGQAARDHHAASGGLLGDAGDAAAITAADVGGRLIDRELQVKPSIRLSPGARVQVLVTHDLVLEPYR